MRTYRAVLESRNEKRGDFIIEGRDIADATRNLLTEARWLCKWVGGDNLTIVLTPIDCDEKRTNIFLESSLTAF